jgi:hypothetical protein
VAPTVNVRVGASAYDPASGVVVFGLPQEAPALKAGKRAAIIQASDYQEAKNINTVGNDIYPNTAFLQSKLTVVNGPTVTWIEPPSRVCAFKTDRLVVVAGATKKIKNVTFSDGKHRIGVDKSGPGGVYSVAWNTKSLSKGTRHLLATVTDASGHHAAAGRALKICK